MRSFVSDAEHLMLQNEALQDQALPGSAAHLEALKN
jgi:hypothetical protein